MNNATESLSLFPLYSTWPLDCRHGTYYNPLSACHPLWRCIFSHSVCWNAVPPLHFERKSKTLKGLSCLGSQTGIVACKNIRFSSLFAAGDVSRETSPAVKSEGETDAFAGYRHRKSVWISMITGITTASPIKVVVPHKHVSKPFELAPTLLSPVFSSGDTQITVTAAIAIFNLPEENRGLCLWSTILDKTVEKNAYLEGHFF